MIASAAIAWAGVVGAFVGPFVGVLGALLLYSKQKKDIELSRVQVQSELVYLQLRAELDANRRIVVRSVQTIEAVLGDQPTDLGDNEPIHDERLYLAPLFADSWSGLARTDAHRVIPRAELDRLFAYYTAVARANWLIARVQRFQFRMPILEEILETLRQLQDPKAAVTVDLQTLRGRLAPQLSRSDL